VPLGDLPGASFQSRANGLSGDGTRAVGYGTASARAGFLWDAANGMQGLGGLGSGFGVISEAAAISRVSEAARRRVGSDRRGRYFAS
jgi:hypothetical protein